MTEFVQCGHLKAQSDGIVISGQGSLSLQQPVSRDWEGAEGCPVMEAEQAA